MTMTGGAIQIVGDVAADQRRASRWPTTENEDGRGADGRAMRSCRRQRVRSPARALSTLREVVPRHAVQSGRRRPRRERSPAPLMESRRGSTRKRAPELLALRPGADRLLRRIASGPVTTASIECCGRVPDSRRWRRRAHTRCRAPTRRRFSRPAASRTRHSPKRPTPLRASRRARLPGVRP